MKAALLRTYDQSNPIRVENVERPVASPGKAIVRVRNASVNPVDWKVCTGMLKDFIPLELPLVPGGDVSGEVVKLGEGVEGLAVGDHVYAMTDTQHGYSFGGYAEYTTVTAEHVAFKPSSVTFAEAAAVPLAALTAWQALHDRGQVKPGQRVLIHAAAGGVGSFAVQFAKLAGAHVTGTASAANHDYVRQLGADEVVDYRSGPFEERLRDIDLVIDLIGGEVQVRSLSVLRPGGTLVNAWGALAEREAAEKGVFVKKVYVVQNAPHLREIGRLIDAGKVSVMIARRFPLAEVAKAMALSRSGVGRGKIVLDVE